jgi:hypothetical protein
MSAFIKLNKQDAYITTYNAHKSWNVLSDEFADYGIEYYLAVSGSSVLTGIQKEVSAGALYSSLKQLYYSGTTTGALLTASFYDDYQQTTIFPSMSRALPDTSVVLAIPQDIFGTAIKPGSFTMGTDEPIYAYVSGGYIATGFFKKGLPDGYNIYDDGEGILRESTNHSTVGYIIYAHGIVNIVDKTATDNITRYQSIKLKADADTIVGVTTSPVLTNGTYTACRKPGPRPIANPFTRTSPPPITDQTGIWYSDRLFNFSGWSYQAGDRLKVSYDANNYYEGTVVKYPNVYTQTDPKTGATVLNAGIYISVDKVFTDGTSPLPNTLCIEPISVAGASQLNSPATTTTTTAVECYLETQDTFIDSDYFVECDVNGPIPISTPDDNTFLPAQLGYSVRWNSTLPVHTRNYRCRVRSEQLNHTYNNTATTGSLEEKTDWLQVPAFADSTLHNNVSDNYFQPYVTAVGLYNDANELIAVGKLGQPTPKSKYTDMTFVVNLDI